MARKQATAAVLLALAALSGTPAEAGQERTVQVVDVVDGDTVDVVPLGGGPQTTVRLLGLDCPEVDTRAGRLAGEHAAELLAGAMVTLESGTRHFERGYYKRLLAYVRLPGGRDFGLHMIRAGWCEDYDWKYPHPRGDLYPGR